MASMALTTTTQRGSTPEPTATTTRSTLVVCRHSCFSSSLAREGLDAILASAAFEQPLAILFMGDGVWQLQQQQDGSIVQQKTPSNSLPVLPMYGVERFYAQRSALEQRGLQADSLVLPVKPISDAEIGILRQEFDTILSF